MHYITLHFMTIYYITLHYITLQYNTLHFMTTHSLIIRYITLQYIILYYTVYYFSLQYISLFWVLEYITLIELQFITLHYTTLLIIYTRCEKKICSARKYYTNVYVWWCTAYPIYGQQNTKNKMGMCVVVFRVARNGQNEGNGSSPLYTGRLPARRASMTLAPRATPVGLRWTTDPFPGARHWSLPLRPLWTLWWHPSDLDWIVRSDSRRAPCQSALCFSAQLPCNQSNIQSYKFHFFPQ